MALRLVLASLAGLAVAEPTPKSRRPPRPTALPAKGPTRRPSKLQLPVRLRPAAILGVGHVALEIVGRSTFPAVVQAFRPLLRPAGPGLQDKKSREPARGVTSLIFTKPLAAVVSVAVPALFVPARRQIPAPLALVHAAPLKRIAASTVGPA